MRARPLHYVLLFLPLFLVAGFIYALGADLPFMDQFGFARRLIFMEKTGAGWERFWNPHNEHRLLFPQLLMWGLSTLTHWSIRAEMAIGFLLSLSGFYLLCHGRFAATPYLCIANALLWFSLSQWENWLWGWQIQIFMMQACAVCCCYCLSRPFAWRYFWVAMAGAVLASFSYGSGLVVWLVALPVWYINRKQRAQNSAAFLFWANAAAWVFYFYFAATPSAGKPPAIPDILALAEYALAFLGAPLAAQHLTAAVILGSIGLGLFALLSLHLYRTQKPGEAFLFFWLLALFALGNAAIISLSRAGFGVDQALSSRYISISNFLWVGLLGAYWEWKPQFAKRVLLPLLLVGVIATSILGFQQGVAHAKRMAHLEPYLQQNAHFDPETLKQLHPHPFVAENVLQWLRKNHMALFRE